MAAARNVVTARLLDPRAIDVAVAIILGLFAQAEVWLTDAGEGQRVATSLAAAAMCISLAWRRVAPLRTTLVVVAAVGLLGTIEQLPVAIFLLPVTLIALYSLASYSSTERAVAGLAVSLVVLGFTTARVPDATITDLTAPAFLFTAAWVTGRIVQTYGKRAVTFERHAARLEAEQEQRERAAEAAERARIARELHDIVAHRVTTIVIQSESGSVMADEPERSRQAFEAISSSGREALAELRRLLGVLKEDGEAAQVEPQPGLSRLPVLIEEMAKAGLNVSWMQGRSPGRLPAGLELTVYRLAQEGLTNALRYGDGRASLALDLEGQALHLEIRNRLSGKASQIEGSGQGLAGLRERVRLAGGWLSASLQDEEFVLCARLPLEEASYDVGARG